MEDQKSQEHRVTYQTTHTFSTLNTLGPNTHTVWVVFHGIGYLSRFFLKYFKDLPADSHFIIAPQAPSKYYLNDTYTHVGASWLTRENTREEVQNVMAYLDAVMMQINIPSGCRIHILGFSQGVSIALRWVCHARYACDSLILYAGGIPNEIKKEDVEFLLGSTQIYIVQGSRDAYLTVKRMAEEEKKIQSIFGEHAKRILFDGGHEMKPEVLAELT